MASAKVIVGVKYNKGERIVVCIPDGVAICTDSVSGPQFIEWEFHPSIPVEVDGVEIKFLDAQPPTYPTKEPIPPERLITSLGRIQEESSGGRIKPRVTTQAATKTGYFFYEIKLTSKGAIWAVSDPGGSSVKPGENPPEWPPANP